MSGRLWRRVTTKEEILEATMISILTGIEDSFD
jgi:hypothetical protein